MLHAFLIKGSFQDSVSLMLISRDLSKGEDVNRVSIMMGTPSNKDVFRETGLWHPILDEAGPNDICAVIDADSEDPSIASSVEERLAEALQKLSQARRTSTFPVVHSFERAARVLPDANIALVSVAGAYAAAVADRALDEGMNVMLFSDNVGTEQEKALKIKASQKGLIVMGPDCGTSIINGAPLAFSNKTESGPVGIVGASGTGIQEVVCQLAARSIGITNAIGLGGRDLKSEVGGISARTALAMMNDDPAAKVVVFVSKPPAASVRDEVVGFMKSMRKPVVALFLGATPLKRNEENIYFAHTLDEAAELAAALVEACAATEELPKTSGRIAGLFTGGTLASETAMLLADALGCMEDSEHVDGVMLEAEQAKVIDLGDDVYTRGRPHPMIDPSVRGEMIEALGEDVGILLLDVVLGFGGAADPAGAVVESLEKLRASRSAPLVVAATVTGTAGDPQNIEEQKEKLRGAGVVLVESTRRAVMLANVLLRRSGCVCSAPKLLTQQPRVVNIGLRSFAEDLHANGAACVHYQWAPACGGDERLQKLLSLMR